MSRLSTTIRKWRAQLYSRLIIQSLGSQPHFIQEYWLLSARLKKVHGERHAEAAVGGDFVAMGKIELACLRHFGLKPGDVLVDVGCGSGRLAAALSTFPDIAYHGTDIVEALLEHARNCSPPRFRFTLVNGLTIPEGDGAADFVTLFSVATHLLHHETYLYLEEAKRVLKPGGRLVMSFLELQNASHWAVFAHTVEGTRHTNLDHLNSFIEEPVIRVWASHLGLMVEAIVHGGEAQIPIDEPIVHEGGGRVEKYADLGQSVAVLRKPPAATEPRA